MAGLLGGVVSRRVFMDSGTETNALQHEFGRQSSCACASTLFLRGASWWRLLRIQCRRQEHISMVGKVALPVLALIPVWCLRWPLHRIRHRLEHMRGSAQEQHMLASSEHVRQPHHRCNGRQRNSVMPTAPSYVILRRCIYGFGLCLK